MKYNPKKFEKKWQKLWEEEGFNRAKDSSKKPKKYILIEFPYPSGEGLHVGHVRSYSALDAIARKKRMEGYNVLFPIGWDAFGLPTENYAIKTGIHPQKTTKKNIANYKKQLKNLGLSLDWSREINTSDPKYYKWTQWIFLKLFEKGLAYQAQIPINWCPSCKIGLANEEVIGGFCERCGTLAEKKILKQWMLKITAYADRLIDDLKKVDYPARVKTQQIEWIGKSYGAEIDFSVVGLQEKIKVFTTRADTLFGATAVVLAPEHLFVASLLKNIKAIEKYIKEAKKKSDFEREKLEKEKTGVFTGSYCLNPVNSEEIPIWIGDYVVATYGGGAVMVVPAHDERDYNFAKKYGLEIREVIKKRKAPSEASRSQIKNQKLKQAFVDYGILVNSGQFTGLNSEEAIEKIIQWLEKKGLGRKSVNYKLRDWVFSRQHYWGEPIPLVFCENCADKIKEQKSKSKNKFSEGELLNPGWIAVPEEKLPVELPYVEKYQPTGTGASPLADISEWLNTTCPKCGRTGKRETDTMPNWAGSNWYYLAYLMQGISKKSLASGQFPISKYKNVFKYWLPVDWYNGGMEHTTLHLLYSRFIYKFLFDIGAVFQSEPYQRRTSHGVVLAADGKKMSKSLGNVINPDDIIQKYGADTLRIYEMFMGPFDQTITWSVQGVKGAWRFLGKVWNLSSKPQLKRTQNLNLERLIHKTIKKLNEDLENCKFNTAISSLMILVNEFEKQKQLSAANYQLLLKLLAPFAPHLAEELWQKIGHSKSIFFEKWPKYDSKLIEEKTFTLIIQINGKTRDNIELSADISKAKAEKLCLGQERIENRLKDKKIRKIIYIPKRLINFVTKG